MLQLIFSKLLTKKKKFYVIVTKSKVWLPTKVTFLPKVIFFLQPNQTTDIAIVKPARISLKPIIAEQSTVIIQVLLTNIGLGWKFLPVRNALVYFYRALLWQKK
jgi:hypothetical protein